MTTNKIAKFKKIFLYFIFIVFLLFLVGIFIAINIATKNQVDFDKDKLIATTTNVSVLDNDGNPLSNISAYGKPIISISNLNNYTKNAFIAIEDKTFYSHKGFNIKRIIKAITTNIKNGYAKEGASTISQQTIKNSHLSNEKTIERKIKELFLTLKLEHSFDKDEILEIYLNIIYFGNGCFGIEQASQTYFNKSASNLTISESATLAGIIKSPQAYSPIYNREKCKNRRDLVLREMLKCKFINTEEYQSALNEPLEIANNFESTINNSIYERMAINEACKLLNINEKKLVKSKYAIYTYLDKQIQQSVDNIVNDNIKLLSVNNKIIESNVMINDIKTGGLVALKSTGELDIFSTRRQPASTIKPLLVYAPALECGLISPETILFDTAININGYSPSNSYNKYLGNISATNALALSSNTCAVNLLNYLGIDNAKKFASSLGIPFANSDNHLALALGAMEYGTTLAELSSAYSCFANQGFYNPTKIVKKITDENNNVLYEDNVNPSRVISKETSYLMNKMLQETSLIGTNKKLSNLTPTPASKTGTNQSQNKNFNIDAYNISYTPEYCINIWCGNTTGNEKYDLDNNYAGGNYNAILSNKIWQEISHYKQLNDFKKPDNIIKVDLDYIDYIENNKLTLASEQTPERYIKYGYFNKKFIPTEISQNFVAPQAPKITYKLTDNDLIISFHSLPHLEYNIYKKTNDEVTLLQNFKNVKNKVEFRTSKICDEITEFYVIAEFKNFENNEIIKSDKSNVVKIFPE